MWCLETIVALNQAVAKCINEDRPTREAYRDCGIKMPTPDSHDTPVYIRKKDKENK